MALAVLGGLSFTGSLFSGFGAAQSATATQNSLISAGDTEINNAKSSYEATVTSASLDEVNAKATYESHLYGDDIAGVQAQSEYADESNQVALGAVAASASYTSAMAGAEESLLSGESQIEQGEAGIAVKTIQAGSQAEALQVGAQISSNNAAVSELQAQAALLQGQNQAEAAYEQGAQKKSSFIASAAAHGIDLGVGSALNVQNSQDLLTQRAVIQIQQNAVMSAFMDRSQEANQLIDAAEKTYQAGMTITTADLENGLTQNQLTAMQSNLNATTELRQTLAQISLTSTTSSLALEQTKADVKLSNENAALDTDKAVSLAGYTYAGVADEAKKSMAYWQEQEGIAAGNVKLAEASDISPIFAAFSSAFSSMSSSAGGLYAAYKAG